MKRTKGKDLTMPEFKITGTTEEIADVVIALDVSEVIGIETAHKCGGNCHNCTCNDHTYSATFLNLTKNELAALKSYYDIIRGLN